MSFEHYYPPLRAKPDWPPALILGAFQTGVVNVRNLRRRGVETSFADADRTLTGFRSRHGPALPCPDPDTEPDAWLRWMSEFGARARTKPVLLASADVFVTAIGRYEVELREHFLFTAAAELAGALANKDTQYALASLHGLRLPPTTQVGSVEEVRRFAREASFPCLLKPLHFREWHGFAAEHPLFHRKLVVAHDSSELLSAYDLASAANPTVILQQIIQGPDTEKRVYLAHYGSSGGRTGFAVFRELRCSPAGFGPATVSESFPDPEAAAICDRFLRAVGYRGICEIELKRDVRDGGFFLVEANPRLSGGGDAATCNGVDLAWLHYLDLIGVTHRPVGQEGRRIRHIVMRPDGETAVQYIRAGALRWSDILRSYRPPVSFFDLDVRDPAISLRNIAGSLRDAARGMMGSADPAIARSLRDSGALGAMPPER